MSYHTDPSEPPAVRALVRRARAAFEGGATTHVCAQRFTSDVGPALYVQRRTEAVAAAALLTGFGPLAVVEASAQSLPTFAAGMTPEAVVYQITVTP